MLKSKIFIPLFLFMLLAPNLSAKASLADDADAYDKYPLHEKYDKKQLYDKYKKFAAVKKKLGFDDAKTKQAAKDGYTNYKLYKKNPKANAAYAKFLPEYNAYKKYKKYSDYSKYKKYKNYDKDKYEKYKKYGSDSYYRGYKRYKAFMNDLDNVTTNLGPEIKVGLWSYSKDDLTSDNFHLSANKTFNVTDCDSTTINATPIPVGDEAEVTYVSGSDGNLEVSSPDSLFTTTNDSDKYCFVSADGNNDDIIFDTNRPDSTYDHYRGKIKIQHSYTTDNQTQEGSMRRIWVINMLPLEQYVWGFGEIGGGVTEHSKAMLVAARTYARWYLQPTVSKWNEEGFNILSTSGSQLYHGYDYEKDHDTVPDLAKKTNGIIMENEDGDIALAAYSSWTDGRTRKYEDGLFGGTCKDATSGDKSSIYPELSAVDDPYGKNSSLTTCQLASAGNHMVGMSANGSLVLARDYGWSWTRILSYYYSGINIVKLY